MHRSTLALYVTLIGITILSLTPSSQAVGYYYPASYVYAPVDTLSPTGAALGPWRWNFNIGGGPTPVVGNSNNQFNSGSNFTVGTGYNFTPRAGFIVEFMDTRLGLTDANLQQHQANDGNAYIWSVTIDPIWRFRIGGPVGGYLIGGGGFYERSVRYDQPVQFFVPDRHGGFYESGIDTVHENDDTGGLNAGAGLTCNLGWGTKFFAEVRYHYVFTGGNGTQIIPVTFGLRW